MQLLGAIGGCNRGPIVRQAVFYASPVQLEGNRTVRPPCLSGGVKAESVGDGKLEHLGRQLGCFEELLEGSGGAG